MVCGKRYCAALRTVRRCPNFIAAKVAYVEGNSCPAWLCLSLRTEIRSVNLSLADSPVSPFAQPAPLAHGPSVAFS